MRNEGLMGTKFPFSKTFWRMNMNVLNTSELNYKKRSRRSVLCNVHFITPKRFF
jgi:hypothetical protein